MSSRVHTYAIDLEWTGNHGSGTQDYNSYGREHILRAKDKMHQIDGSSDPAFRGDPTRWNPEEMLLTSIASCHKLWYLHLCTDARINVVAYTDHATGQMSENPDGSGQFDWVHLHPSVIIAKGGDAKLAHDLHGRVGAVCFVARSVNFQIKHDATITTEKPNP